MNIVREWDGEAPGDQFGWIARVIGDVDGAPGDQLGTGLDAAGDVDGDGYADVIVGAPGNNAHGKGAGRAYVYSGRDGHLLLTLNGERAGDAFGSTVAGYADDQHRFLVVGAPGAGPHQTGRVRIFVISSGVQPFVPKHRRRWHL